MSFIKKGAAAAAAMEAQKAKQEQAQKGKAFRFFIPTDTETAVTFLDGDLNDENIIDIPMYYEHQVHQGGHWRNWYVCLSEEESCPLCEGGDDPSLVGALTIIDHTEWKDKQGNMHKDERKLFIAKYGTIQTLQKMAEKRGGLAGCTFDVYRGSDKKSPNVGDTFDFTEKHTAKGMEKKYGEQAAPFDYEEVLPYVPAPQLRKMGFGVTAVGGEPPIKDSEGSGKEYDQDL